MSWKLWFVLGGFSNSLQHVLKEVSCLKLELSLQHVAAIATSWFMTRVFHWRMTFGWQLPCWVINSGCSEIGHCVLEELCLCTLRQVFSSAPHTDTIGFPRSGLWIPMDWVLLRQKYLAVSSEQWMLQKEENFKSPIFSVLKISEASIFFNLPEWVFPSPTLPSSWEISTHIVGTMGTSLSPVKGGTSRLTHSYSKWGQNYSSCFFIILINFIFTPDQV